MLKLKNNILSYEEKIMTILILNTQKKFLFLRIFHDLDVLF